MAVGTAANRNPLLIFIPWRIVFHDCNVIRRPAMKVNTENKTMIKYANIRSNPSTRFGRYGSKIVILRWELLRKGNIAPMSETQTRQNSVNSSAQTGVELKIYRPMTTRTTETTCIAIINLHMVSTKRKTMSYTFFMLFHPLTRLLNGDDTMNTASSPISVVTLLDCLNSSEHVQHLWGTELLVHGLHCFDPFRLVGNIYHGYTHTA